VFSAHQAPFILSPPDPKYPNPKTLAGGLFAEDASDGYKVKSESPSTEYILVEDFQADSIGSTFLEANLDRGSSLPSMELNFACIDWVSSSSARVQISPDAIGVTYVVRPRTDDPVDGAQGCLSNSGNTQNLL
jgi:hypothetical protein